MTPVSARSGAFDSGGRAACVWPVRGSGFNTTGPFPAAGPVARMDRCEKEPAVIVVLDEAQAHADLRGSALGCPDCLGSCDAGASPGPARCAALLVGACL